MNGILLKDIWPIENVRDYKVHFGRWNGEYHPLDEWVDDPRKWQSWQEYRGARNDFNRELIFSLMDLYTETDAWIFGGVYRVVGRHSDRYDINLEKCGEMFVGRLKIRSDYRSRLMRVNFENHYDRFEVLEILREPYSGRVFPGYEAIDIHLTELRILIRNDKADWKAALEHIKGIYMITDEDTGKRYVGSAYGDQGIWGRWADYAQSGHGGNKELEALLGNRDPGYAGKNFLFALLEYRPFNTSDATVIDRENYWKTALLTKDCRYGYNRN